MTENIIKIYVWSESTDHMLNMEMDSETELHIKKV